MPFLRLLKVTVNRITQFVIQLILLPYMEKLIREYYAYFFLLRLL